VCVKTNRLSNMGKAAIESHAKGELRVFHFDLTFELFAGASACRVKCAQKNV